MKPLGFRQANAWLHTWVGLLLGWLLYAVFLTGTLSFFHEEISFWMKPEQHGSQPHSGTAMLAYERMQQLAPDAAQWNINLPDERDHSLQVQWFEQGERVGRGGGQRLTLDAASAEPIEVRETRGGGFLYRFHFELYGLPRVMARWIVGVATMAMLIAIVSGVITHKKIFKDFFTFRPRKGQRSWLDAHNASAVLALPFHFMITYSGLLLLMFMLMPWAVDSVYQGDTQKFFQESGGRGGGQRGEATPVQNALPAPLTDIAPLLAQAHARWPRGVADIRVSQPGRQGAVIELRENGGDSLVERGASERLRFDGVTGVALGDPLSPATPAVNAVYNVFTSLHLIRFAGPPLRWFFFLSGLIGTAMVATGLILWVVKRLPERKKLGRTPWGQRLVEVLNVGTVAGLPLAIGAYFWANRLLPATLADRGTTEIRCFFIVWALCLIHPLLRRHKQAWIEQLFATAVLYAGLPLFGLTTPGSGLPVTLREGNWLLVAMDLSLLVAAVAFAWSAMILLRHQPLVKVKPAKVSPARRAPV
ncbi:PepSY-associated TM helix domain-containing protein [Halopseudomonas pelagia]|uniref:PepSY domain-containing protein n=1 Tax=Halopseudomonas pelagia TaxID=553151 RepID=A0AA91U155_9GAMM|nr:PepSY-associated TM helix domain-containing protein [Halopseudomonas pelagia]PCC98126.1 hypothetical protein CO192_17235 [Halopseudomonas pelagia]QFY55061.1 PepSY domain-containing protein [Halopseudomonas pelagia]